MYTIAKYTIQEKEIRYPVAQGPFKHLYAFEDSKTVLIYSRELSSRLCFEMFFRRLKSGVRVPVRWNILLQVCCFIFCLLFLFMSARWPFILSRSFCLVSPTYRPWGNNGVLALEPGPGHRLCCHVTSPVFWQFVVNKHSLFFLNFFSHMLILSVNILHKPLSHVHLSRVAFCQSSSLCRVF